MPKTLAALPSSQYATTLALVSGKKDFVDFLLSALRILLLRDERGEDGLRTASCPKLAVILCVLPDRNALKKIEFLEIRWTSCDRTEASRVAWQVKNCRESLGAACLSEGNIDNVNAMKTSSSTTPEVPLKVHQCSTLATDHQRPSSAPLLAVNIPAAFVKDCSILLLLTQCHTA